MAKDFGQQILSARQAQEVRIYKEDTNELYKRRLENGNEN